MRARFRRRTQCNDLHDARSRRPAVVPSRRLPICDRYSSMICNDLRCDVEAGCGVGTWSVRQMHDLHDCTTRRPAVTPSRCLPWRRNTVICTTHGFISPISLCCQRSYFSVSGARFARMHDCLRTSGASAVGYDEARKFPADSRLRAKFRNASLRTSAPVCHTVTRSTPASPAPHREESHPLCLHHSRVRKHRIFRSDFDELPSV